MWGHRAYCGIVYFEIIYTTEVLFSINQQNKRYFFEQAFSLPPIQVLFYLWQPAKSSEYVLIMTHFSIAHEENDKEI